MARTSAKKPKGRKTRYAVTAKHRRDFNAFANSFGAKMNNIRAHAVSAIRCYAEGQVSAAAVDEVLTKAFLDLCELFESADPFFGQPLDVTQRRQNDHVCGKPICLVHRTRAEAEATGPEDPNAVIADFIVSQLQKYE